MRALELFGSACNAQIWGFFFLVKRKEDIFPYIRTSRVKIMDFPCNARIWGFFFSGNGKCKKHHIRLGRVKILDFPCNARIWGFFSGN